MKKILLSAMTCVAIFAGGSDVVATIGGKNVTKDELSVAFSSMPGMDFEKLSAEERKKALNQYIDRKLIIESAQKEGIENSKEYKESFEKIKDELAFDSWMKKQFESIKLTDTDAKNYYETNKNKFMQPAMIKARHILLKTEDEAKAIIKQLKDKKENTFSELAKTATQDPSGKQNGGDLGWFAKEQMVKEFSQAASAMKKGEISKTPVKTQFGWHVIYLADKKEPKTISFEESKERIKQSLKMEKLKEKISAKSKELRAKTKVELKI